MLKCPNTGYFYSGCIDSSGPWHQAIRRAILQELTDACEPACCHSRTSTSYKRQRGIVLRLAGVDKRENKTRAVPKFSSGSCTTWECPWHQQPAQSSRTPPSFVPVGGKLPIGTGGSRHGSCLPAPRLHLATALWLPQRATCCHHQETLPGSNSRRGTNCCSVPCRYLRHSNIGGLVRYPGRD